MKRLLLTYDIQEKPGIHAALKKYLIDTYSWSDRIRSDAGKEYILPNTTLIKLGQGLTTQQGSSEFVTACAAVGAKWEKYICVEWSFATFDNQ